MALHLAKRRYRLKPGASISMIDFICYEKENDNMKQISLK